MRVSVLSKFFRPRSLETRSYSGKDGKCYMVGFVEPLPRVVLVTDKLLRQWDPETPSLEELGYAEYDKSLIMRATYYARPPWVWALKAWMRARRVWWGAVNWTHGRLWHTSYHRWPFRWRDLRPGSGAVSEARISAAGLRVRVDQLTSEVDDLKHEKISSRARDMKEGWDQFAGAMRNYLGGGMTPEEAVARLRPEEDPHYRCPSGAACGQYGDEPCLAPRGER